MGQTLRVISGSQGGPWDSTLRNEGVAVPYPPDATFLATVSRGGEEASLATPFASWISAAAGTFFISISAAQTAALEPGVYLLQVFVLSGGVRHDAFDGQLEILPAVGTVADRIPYFTDSDMRIYHDQVDTLANRASDTTGFLNVRVNASDKIDRWLVRRYDPRPGFVKVRQATVDPGCGSQDVASPTAIAPSKAHLTAALSAGGLVAERELREIGARWALADILGRQEAEGPNPYRAESQSMRSRADDMWGRYQAQVDLSTTTYPQKATYPNALFDRDVILLPAGTAP